jgi:hypothetical protein
MSAASEAKARRAHRRAIARAADARARRIGVDVTDAAV